jgi:hypothetical protein
VTITLLCTKPLSFVFLREISWIVLSEPAIRSTKSHEISRRNTNQADLIRFQSPDLNRRCDSGELAGRASSTTKSFGLLLSASQSVLILNSPEQAGPVISPTMNCRLRLDCPFE